MRNPLSLRSTRLHLEFDFEEAWQKYQKVLKHLTKQDATLVLTILRYTFNQTDKDFKGKYRKYIIINKIKPGSFNIEDCFLK